MSKNVLAAVAKETVYTAAKKMAARNIGSIIVVDRAFDVLGIFTERDLMNRVVARNKDVHTTRLKEVMTENPIVIGSSNSIATVFLLFKGSGFRHFPVVDKKKKLVGMISIKDITKAVSVR